MVRTRTSSVVGLTAFLAVSFAVACSGETSGTGPEPGVGRLAVYLTDAPFPFDSVRSVDVFVVRIDAKLEATTEADADSSVESPSRGGWVTVATPNRSIDLLTLRNGKTENIGETSLPSGTYRSLRLIIDADRSSVTLASGATLTGGSDPGVKFPSAGTSGLKIQLDEAVSVADSTTKLLVDFDVGSSFVLRGNSLERNGLLFKPVIRASVMED
jgi:hypothetical protein